MTLYADIKALVDQLEQQEQDNDAISLATINTLREQIRKLTTPTPTATTIFGGSINATTKYGNKTAVRWFDNNNGITNIPMRPNCSVFMPSWKLFGKQQLTDQLVSAAVHDLKPGDMPMVEHEYDADYRRAVNASNANAQHDLDTRQQLMADFNVRVARVRPDLFTVKTVTGFAFSPAQFGQINRFFADGYPLNEQATYLGVDLDGSAGQPTYHDYADPVWLANINTIVTRYGFKGVVVPEYCLPRLTGDPTGMSRINEFKRQIPLIVAAIKPKVLCWWDSPTVAGAALTLPGEIAAWKTFVDQNS